jgi:histidyl-tRNA synthetase
MPTKLKPQPLRGFNDWFSADIKLREFVIQVFIDTFEKYGYEPLETPALEYTEFMLGISGEEAEKQFYRFRDPGNRDVMLKYEVMTGMCRAVATNIQNISFPYKRYQIQPVWRSENTQKGRYRQFTQCDADTIGSPSILADAEFIQMGLEITQKLGFTKFQAKISNRKFLNGLREYLQIPESKFYGLCMSVDKLQKIGPESVEKELVEKRQISSSTATQILTLIGSSNSPNDFSATIGQTESGKIGLAEISQIFDYLTTSQVDQKLYRFDPSLARGLASYTGPIWEFEVIDGNVGSIAGCGRYDNLIGRYLGGKTIIPATGGSFGIERICDIIKDRQMLDLGTTNTQLLVTIFSPDTQADSIKLANQLRQANINTFLYPTPEKLSKQFKYASEKSIPYVAVLGPDELKSNTITLKNMATGEQQTISSKDLPALLV